MAISANEVIYAAIGFFLCVIVTPIAMGQFVATSTSGWDTATVTVFQVLVPVMYMIGMAMHFIPKLGGGK